jgi:hypothetical protein
MWFGVIERNCNGSGLLVWGFGLGLGLGFARVGSEIGYSEWAPSRYGKASSLVGTESTVWVDSVMVVGATWRDGHLLLHTLSHVEPSGNAPVSWPCSLLRLHVMSSVQIVTP